MVSNYLASDQDPSHQVPCQENTRRTTLVSQFLAIKYCIATTSFYTALVTLSVDKFLAGTTDKTTNTSKPTVELPSSYGRALPISEEEITAINVSMYLHLDTFYNLAHFFLQLGGAR